MSQARTKTLKTLIQHDAERWRAWDQMHPKDYNGIACPACSEELYDEKDAFGGSISLTTSPPRVPVRCACCPYQGSRLA